MLAPSHGPIHPYRFNQIQTGHGIQQVGMGHVEDAAMDDYAFDDQYKTYLKNGYAFDLNDNSILGSFSSFVASQGESTKTTKGLWSKHISTFFISNSFFWKIEKILNSKRKRIEDDFVDLGDGENGPWATPVPESFPAPAVPTESVEESKDGVTLESIPVPMPALPKPKRDKNQQTEILLPPNRDGVIPENVHIVEPDEEAEKWERVNEKKLTFTLPPRPARGSCIGEVS
jgi:hypothetical protein